MRLSIEVPRMIERDAQSPLPATTPDLRTCVNGSTDSVRLLSDPNTSMMQSCALCETIQTHFFHMYSGPAGTSAREKWPRSTSKLSWSSLRFSGSKSVILFCTITHSFRFILLVTLYMCSVHCPRGNEYWKACRAMRPRVHAAVCHGA